MEDIKEKNGQQNLVNENATNLDREPQISNPPGDSKKPSKQRIGSLIQQIGINILVVGVVALLAYITYERFFYDPGQPDLSSNPGISESGGAGGPLSSSPVDLPAIELSPLSTPVESLSQGIFRTINYRTIIPSRPRDNIITYTVSTGDTLFSIANNFGLKPETILWGNYEVLNDNPHFLKPDQLLTILPVDGTFYQWEDGDTLTSVAEFFKAEPQDILNYPGNNFDLTLINTDGASITAGTWIIVPGGKREIRDWGPPAITRQNPASARYYGAGACGDIYTGAVGTGTFIWPTTDRSVSGYAYDPSVHPAIDISGSTGNPIYATDSGVVVYAGWSDYGYGLLIVIDHGNGWQSAYAHLSTVAVSCGQSVYQGGFIGSLGSTGNSSGPHLHFELVINGVKVNPMDYVR